MAVVNISSVRYLPEESMKRGRAEWCLDLLRKDCIAWTGQVFCVGGRHSDLNTALACNNRSWML